MPLRLSSAVHLHTFKLERNSKKDVHFVGAPALLATVSHVYVVFPCCISD